MSDSPPAVPPRRPSALWAGLAAWLIVLLPVVALEWRSEPARWKAAAAAELALDGQFAEARGALDAALQMDPGNPQLIRQRAALLAEWAKQDRPWRQTPRRPAVGEQQRGELLRAALRDVTAAIEKSPADSALRSLRADIRLDLGDNQGAVDDWLAVEQSPDGLPPEQMLNGLAYIRACANLQLEPALADANEALGYVPNLSHTRIAVLDTRGYIHHLLGNEERAVEDLNESVSSFREHFWDKWDFDKMAHSEIDIRVVRMQDRDLREEFAVMLHHRRLAVLESDPETAAEDLNEIRSLLPGYDGRPLR